MDDRGYATKYSYDPTTGTLGSVETPNGGVTKYTYNANNDRLEKVTSHDSASGSATTTVRYAYSSRGDLSGITTPSTAYTFTYDAFGNPLKTAAGAGPWSLIPTKTITAIWPPRSTATASR